MWFHHALQREKGIGIGLQQRLLTFYASIRYISIKERISNIEYRTTNIEIRKGKLGKK
jgi:hypothetical protein